VSLFKEVALPAGGEASRGEQRASAPGEFAEFLTLPAYERMP
jgi:hypothetical protein